MIEYKRIRLEKIKNTERFISNENYLDDAIAEASNRIFDIMPQYVHKYPTACSENLYYEAIENATDYKGSNWTPGFWTGMLWTCYELTNNELFRAVAEAQYDDWKDRLDNRKETNHHDIGFLYMPSVVAQYKITGSEKARLLALEAADILAKRYSDVAKIIHVRDRNMQGEFIVDCSMNIPLLYWAAIETGDRSYYLKALNHITRVVECMVRDDASTYQCYKIDEITGEPIRGWTGQGYSDESCWARGQSWAIYGLALSYKYTLDPDLLKVAKCLANYCLNRLPSDCICGWDLCFTENDAQRDSSAAAIIACGLLELSKYLSEDDIDKQVYQNAANKILCVLSKEYMTPKNKSNGLLMHAVYGHVLGKDECCLWGDYYYLEGLLRLKNPQWNAYW